MRDAHGEHVVHPDPKTYEGKGDDCDNDRPVPDERRACETGIIVDRMPAMGKKMI